MSVENIVFLLEEKSSKNLIDAIAPQILPEGVSLYSFAFDGKSDLEKNIVLKMRGWLKPNTVFLVMRDQDSADCKLVKRNLMEKCSESRVPSDRYMVRIACHELESFFLGDLDAVRAAGYKITLSKKFKTGYDNPDSMTNAAEELAKITGQAYRKIQGSKDISCKMKLDGSNKSVSFNMLVSGIRKLVDMC